MSPTQQIIEAVRLYAHRTNLERVEDAVRDLQRFGDDVVSGLVEAVTDKDDFVRVLALEVLYELECDTSAALPAIIRALDDPDRIVRICAASAVSQHVDRAGEALPLLTKWLGSDDDHICLTAAALILRIDLSQHDQMMPVLRGGMDSDDTGIRCLTAWLLSGLRDVTTDALAILQEMIEDQDDLVRSVVVEQLTSVD